MGDNVCQAIEQPKKEITIARQGVYIVMNLGYKGTIEAYLKIEYPSINITMAIPVDEIIKAATDLKALEKK